MKNKTKTPNPLNKYLYHCFDDWFRLGGTVWVYSDPHFADPEMPAIRRHYITDEEQVRRINSRVGKNDTIIFLGDIGDVSFIKKIRGYKVLVLGNHDKGASTYLRNVVEQYSIDHMSDEERVSLKEALIQQDSHVIDKFCRTIEKIASSKDNRLFDEVYSGPIFIADRMILSHEPIDLPFAFNVHGHDHSNWHPIEHGLNVCAEHIDYYPVNLINLFKSGYLKDIKDIHRFAIDSAIARSTDTDTTD